MTVTYLGLTDEGYCLGSCDDVKQAVDYLRLENSIESYYFLGNVERVIRETGPRKVFNLVRIVEDAKL